MRPGPHFVQFSYFALAQDMVDRNARSVEDDSLEERYIIRQGSPVSEEVEVVWRLPSVP